MKHLVLFDGTIHSKIALRYGIHRSQAGDGPLFILSVFSNEMLPYYDAIPRVEDIVRRDARLRIDEAVKIVKDEGQGIKAYLIEEEGDIDRAISKNISSENIDIVYAPPNFRGLIKPKSCPVAFIPGHFLLPLDENEPSESNIELLIKETAIALSDVILLGIVPVHIYSAAEQEELKDVSEKTLLTVKSVAKRLWKAKIKSREILCSGYPDEEILKAYKDLSVSIILFLEGTDRASELNKAVNLLLDDREKCSIPIFINDSTQDKHTLRLKNCP